MANMSYAQAKLHPTPKCIQEDCADQMKTDGLLKNGCYGVQVADDDLAVLKATYGPEQGYSGKYKDD